MTSTLVQINTVIFNAGMRLSLFQVPLLASLTLATSTTTWRHFRSLWWMKMMQRMRQCQCVVGLWQIRC